MEPCLQNPETKKEGMRGPDKIESNVQPVS